jgi:predicted enzyme related to lactoylglutathione lyase
MRVSTIGFWLLAGALAFALEDGSTARKANDRRIDYIEFHTEDLARTKAFYTQAFGWKFTDYGPEYTAFDDGRLSGGFWKQGSAGAGPLVILYATDLAGTEARIRAAGGTIVKPAYAFPGGRRFHFADPGGNVLAVWSEK